MQVSETIRKRREELGLTQDELARLTGYKSRSSINKIEQGENDLPRQKVELFAEALRIPPARLMGWEDSARPVSDEEIKFALFGGDAAEIDDETFEEVKRYARYLKERGK